MTKSSEPEHREKPRNKAPAKDRETRLKEALRANLHRRKGQSRARAGQDDLKTED